MEGALLRNRIQATGQADTEGPYLSQGDRSASPTHPTCDSDPLQIPAANDTQHGRGGLRSFHHSRWARGRWGHPEVTRINGSIDINPVDAVVGPPKAVARSGHGQRLDQVHDQLKPSVRLPG